MEMIFTEQYKNENGHLVDAEIYVTGNDPFIAAIELCREAKDQLYYTCSYEEGKRVEAFKNLGNWYVLDEIWNDGWYVVETAKIASYVPIEF